MQIPETVTFDGNDRILIHDEHMVVARVACGGISETIEPHLPALGITERGTYVITYIAPTTRIVDQRMVTVGRVETVPPPLVITRLDFA